LEQSHNQRPAESYIFSTPQKTKIDFLLLLALATIALYNRLPALHFSTSTTLFTLPTIPGSRRPHMEYGGLGFSYLGSLELAPDHVAFACS